MNKLAIFGIVAALMVATTVVATVQEADARIVIRDNNRNGINVCDDCQSGQNTGDNSLNTNGGIFQSR